MSAGFESQWDADWFQTRAEQCFRLAAGLSSEERAATLRLMGLDFQQQAQRARELEAEASALKEHAGEGPVDDRLPGGR